MLGQPESVGASRISMELYLLELMGMLLGFGEYYTQQVVVAKGERLKDLF